MRVEREREKEPSQLASKLASPSTSRRNSANNTVSGLSTYLIQSRGEKTGELPPRPQAPTQLDESGRGLGSLSPLPSVDQELVNLTQHNASAPTLKRDSAMNTGERELGSSETSGLVDVSTAPQHELILSRPLRQISDETPRVVTSARLTKTHRFIHFFVDTSRISGRDLYKEVNQEVENYVRAHITSLVHYSLKQHKEAPREFTAMLITEGLNGSLKWVSIFNQVVTPRLCAHSPDFIELRPTAEVGEKVLVPSSANPLLKKNSN